MNYNHRLELFKKSKVVNWHEHVWYGADGKLNRTALDLLVKDAKLTCMDKLVISLPITSGHASPEAVRKANDTVAEAIALYPDVLYGLAFVDPVHGSYAVEEIKRCINELGFVGIKMYHQYTMDDPMQYPIIECCINLNIPILMHAGKVNQVPNPQPLISTGLHFRNIAKLYPEAKIIMAHIGGGGDWNYQLKGMAECPNIFTDVSGSVYDADMIEDAVRIMGAERILFGTDGSFSAGIGKLLSANISDEDIVTILNNPTFDKFLK